MRINFLFANRPMLATYNIAPLRNSKYNIDSNFNMLF